MRSYHMRRLALLAAVGFCAMEVRADWLVSTYRNQTKGEIRNYATADALIGGFQLQGGAPFTQIYTSSNTQDNNDGGGPFGLGVQVGGLPAGDNNDFVFVGTGGGVISVSGNYEFFTNTDDGSRLRASVGGGPVTQIISDDVLSGPHTVGSGLIALPAGVPFTFDWMWFEAGGGAEGELFYSRDGGPQALITDPTQGISLTGGSYTGKMYKSIVTPGTGLGGGLTVANALANDPANLVGSANKATVNTNNAGDGTGDGQFPNGYQPPGLAPNQDDFVVKSTGYLKIVTEGDYKFAALSDDGSQLIIKSQDGLSVLGGIDDDTFHGADPANDIKYSGTIHLLPGFYPISFLWFEAGGGASGELFLVNPANNAVIALVGDEANGGLQVVPEPGSLSLIGLAAMGLMRRRRKA